MRLVIDQDKINVVPIVKNNVNCMSSFIVNNKRACVDVSILFYFSGKK